jgi:predicted benzoate:H+ symporter BenE
MAYGPGRSRFLQGTLIGAGVWVAAALVYVALLVFAFGVVEPGEFEPTFVLIYPLIVVWFVLLAVFPNDSVIILLVIGSLSSLFLTAAGALAVSRIDAIEGAWDAFKVGASIAIGHALVTVLAFSTLEAGIYTSEPAFRTFALAFGGFVVPAAFGAVGGVLYWRFERQ